MATEAARYGNSQGRRGDRRMGQPGRSQRYPSDGFGRERPAELRDFEAASAVIVERGPATMQKEDVLDLCARYDIFVTPEQVTPQYRRNAGRFLICTGWKLALPSTSDRKRAHAISTRDVRVVRFAKY